MYKEFAIILIILVFVIGLDIITNNYIKETTSVMSNELKILEENIMKESLDDMQTKMTDIKNMWQKRYNILAYYIEHDELEKVGAQLSVIEANIKVTEYGNAVEDIEETIFTLKHIKEKEQFNLISIF